MKREYIEVEGIKEDLCLMFYHTCEKLQKRMGVFNRVSYKNIMPEMHISKKKLQKILNAIAINELYFKIERGYILEISNIVMSIDWSTRVYYHNNPAYHFFVTKYKTSK